jgi:CheY-like chemotaxis protein
MATARDEDKERPPALRILVIEDNPDAALSLKILLTAQGHEVAIATDGASGLRAAEEQMPDVVLLNIRLPKLGGYEVAQRLRARRPEARPFIIAITGHGRAEDKQKSLAAGISLHLVKPVDPEMLLELLERFRRITKG